jgi:hypothetical protein
MSPPAQKLGGACGNSATAKEILKADPAQIRGVLVTLNGG